MQTVITGATGFIGRRLTALLSAGGHEVVCVARDAPKAQAALGRGVTVYAWSDGAAWKRAVGAADAVFHLSGENVGGERWTPEVKDKILRSRVETTRAIADAGPRVLISASATGYYGDRGNEVITEETPPAPASGYPDFLAQVCVAWEAEAMRAADKGGRVVCLRTGIGLGKGGGALESLLKPPMLPFSPFRWGLGGPLGSGKQWWPWVHLEDVVRMYIWAAEHANVSGPVNAVAPKPVTNRDFTYAVGHALQRPTLVPVPKIALELLVGEFAETLLYSQRVIPANAQAAGFTFRHPEIGPALVDILR